MAAVAVASDEVDAGISAAEAGQLLTFAPTSPVLDLVDFVLGALKEDDLDEFLEPPALLVFVTAGSAYALDDLADRDKRFDRWLRRGM